MKLEQSFPNNFTFINGDGTKFQFDKNEENQYYIFDSIESSILTNQAVFLHTSSSSASEWNALLTLPSDPTISQIQVIEEIIKEYNRFAKFTTKGTGQFFYPFKGSELNFSDFDYPQLIYYSNIPLSGNFPLSTIGSHVASHASSSLSSILYICSIVIFGFKTTTGFTAKPCANQ